MSKNKCRANLTKQQILIIKETCELIRSKAELERLHKEIRLECSK